MDSAKFDDKHEDTGLGLTFVSRPEEFLIEKSAKKHTSSPAHEEIVDSTKTEVSSSVILPDNVSLRPKIEEISSITNADIIVDSSNTRPRTLTAKGREYKCGLKRSAAIDNDRQFRSKLDTFKEQILSGKDPKEIKEDISALIKELDIVLQSFDQWIELSDDSDETHQATSKQTYLLDTWKAVHDTAVKEIDKLQNDAASITSQRSHRSRVSKGSGSSRSSCKETLLEFRAKRAALEETLKFSAVIAEQKQKLEQLKIQKELGEVTAQEQVYQKAMQEENCLQSPALPTETYDPISTFIASNNADEYTSTPGAPATTLVDTRTPVTKVTVTSSSTPLDVVSVSLNQGPQGSTNRISHSTTATTFSLRGQAPPVYTSPACTMSQIGLTPPRGFCGNFPAFVPSSYTAYSPAPQDYSVQLTDTLAKISQLQRLPQATPDVFKGDETDKTKFFLWENSFDSLIDSAPVTAQQKLHFLYQYLDGKAKKVVEQLQYLVQNPESAYQQARTILKERFGHPAIISTSFQKKLTTWPKVGPNDAAALEEFSDFLQQVKIASEHILSLQVLNYPSQIQSLVEKLPSWFKPKWSDKVLKLQKKEGKDTFPSFADFAQEVRYHAERVNIPQIVQASGSSGTPQTDRFKPLNRQPRLRPPAVNLTSTSPPSNNGETNANHEEPIEISNVLSTHAQQPDTTKATAANTYCFYHKMKSHSMNDCEQFQKLGYEERRDFLMKNKVCLKCVNSNKHVARDCEQDRLDCKICRQKHATVLHDPSRHKVINASEARSACSRVCNQGHSARSCARIVLVEVFHQDNPSARMLTYAVLDDQSTDVFITDTLLDQLQVKGQEVNLNISTIAGVNTVRTQKVNGLHIKDTDSRHNSIKIPFAYSQEKIPASHQDIATPNIAQLWPHLKEIAHHIHYHPGVEIGLLIGRNIPSAFQPLHVIYGKDNEPWAEEYKFGWTIIGPVCLDNQQDSTACATVNRITVRREDSHNLFNVPTSNSSREEAVASFASKHQSKDVTTPQQIREMMQLDYSELHHSRTIRGTENTESVEDRRFNDLLTTSIHTNELGNWEMPLPLRTDKLSLPNNREQCLNRLLGIKRKLLKNGKVLKQYTEFMQKMFNKNHASLVPSDQLKTATGKVWYLPHFDIYHPKKPDQIRIVFDCSAIFHNESLNKHLLQGPDMMNALVGVLSRFRKEETAVTCDIEQMFHSFHVSPEHRDFLRFLWFKDNNLESQIVEYSMNVHLFGAVSSPGVANFGLRMTAEAGREQFGNEAADFLKNDFYVDDGLKSFATPAKAINVIKNTQAMCAAVNLRLHKFASNSETVLEALPAEDRSKDLKDLDLRHDVLPVQRSLGTYWCIQSDTIGFRIELKDKPLTRRGILSTVSSVYDPLGVIAPVILVGKQLLQELCREGIDWDDPVPAHIRSQWEKWRSELPLVETIKIARCLKPPDFGEPVAVELHSFSDASNTGLGQVTYLRLVNSSGQVHVSFLMGKARVAPLKPMSIPRLELTAAVVATNVASMLSQELNYSNPVKLFYTDSSVVLGYIRNDARRFHTYVGNRVQHIRDRSNPQQWHYVSSPNNPADIASRGATTKELSEHELWFNGPEFLWESEVPVISLDQVADLQHEDVEVKKPKSTVCISSHEETKSEEKESSHSILEPERFRHSSSLIRLKRSIVRIQRMIEQRRPNRQFNTRPNTGPPSVEELRLAEEVILKSVQFEHFGKEIQILQNANHQDGMFQDRHSAHTRNETIKKTSSLYKLDPFLDSKGILRIGGRLLKAELDYGIKHPIICPKKSHVTNLLIRHFHSKEHHPGYGMTHNSIRQAGYWIVNGRSVVSHLLSSCAICHKLRGRAQVQKMANLPEERVTQAPPFTYTGMDVFGPWYIKEGRKELKRWGIVFTCLSSRAIHLETLNTMETSSFINALRRFINRRGKVRQLRSDQGSNFIGGRNELNAEVNTDTVKNFLLTQECDFIEFKMNFPSSSHMGGVWERMIRTVRSSLSGLLEDQSTQLDDEGLRTLFTEAENLVNSRPLTTDSLSDPQAPEPITPNHLLTLKTKAVLPPPGNFSRPDLYTRKRWRRVQFLADQFWLRWQREYCLQQQKRQKWNKTVPNVQVDDIVLICEDSSPRNEWPLARVTQVYPSDDGLVRKVSLFYTESGNKKLLDRPIHKLILVHRPKEETTDASYRRKLQ